ncbi:unnamed protein product, partial [Laminaria digitata]
DARTQRDKYNNKLFVGDCLIRPGSLEYNGDGMSKRRKASRSLGDLDEREDAYLVPSGRQDYGDGDNWSGGTVAKRARGREGKPRE